MAGHGRSWPVMAKPPVFFNHLPAETPVCPSVVIVSLQARRRRRKFELYTATSHTENGSSHTPHTTTRTAAAGRPNNRRTTLGSGREPGDAKNHRNQRRRAATTTAVAWRAALAVTVHGACCWTAQSQPEMLAASVSLGARFINGAAHLPVGLVLSTSL